MSNFHNFNKKFSKVQSVNINSRLREDIFNITNSILKVTGISRRDFIEIALIEHALRFDINLKYEGIDFKKYFEVLKYEKLRSYQAKIKASIMSRALFMNRVRYDVLKLCTLNASKEDIKEYLEETKKQANLYPNCDKLIIHFEKKIDLDNLNYSDLIRQVTQQIETEKAVNNEDTTNQVYKEMLLPEK